MSIRVLIVEDSRVVRELLSHLLDSDPAIEVIGTARNGEEALEATKRLKPDVITMDINMPGMDGYAATRRIMESHPTPIVIVSVSVDAKEVRSTIGALDAGALAAVQKPAGIGHPAHKETAKTLVQTVKLMSEVKVVRRWAQVVKEKPLSAVPLGTERQGHLNREEIRIVAIGASTGGPPALRTILSRLPGDFPIPVLIVQHMSPGFIAGFADLLTHSCRLPVEVAVHGKSVLPGHVYLAPDGVQMKVVSGGRIEMTRDPPEGGVRPSVSYLFRSVAEIYGQGAVGVLLTGMGRDGAEELQLMKTKGAATVVQDKKSSVVFGMPGEAIKLDAASYVLPPERIASLLIDLAQVRRSGVKQL